ncbi:MAG: serine hydrolase [Acidobacteria bacterium]|nr:serine hydrolase [Acidobacteriota bacterium]
MRAQALILLLLVGAVPCASAGSAPAPGTPEELIARLDTGDDAQRWEAVRALGELGGAAVPGLAQALAAAPVRVRAGAAGALGRIGEPAAAAVPALVNALADPEPEVREAAAEALGHIGPAARAAVDPLVAAFADPDPYLGGAAAVALGRIGADAVPAVTRALGHADENVRWSSAIALGRLGAAARDAVPALAGALADGSDNVRACAAAALGEIGPPSAQAIPALTEALHDRSEDVRRSARTALARIAPTTRAVPPDPAGVIAKIEQLVPALMDELHVPGASVAVIRDGAVAWSKPFGVSDARTKAPVTRDTLFEAASMSKPIFAVLAMQLVAAGALDLDRPLAAYAAEPLVPDLPERRRLTARHVLSHVSGLPNWRPGGEEREGPLPQLFEPGARFGYSGEAIFYLQRVVEHITGKPLELLAREALFAPLGLQHTSYSWSPAVDAFEASGHADDGTFLEKSKYTHANAAYTLYTTADEYARLLAEVMQAEHARSKVLSRRSAREMLRRQVAVDARDPIERPGAAQASAVRWGLGWSINATKAGDIYHHSGANRTGFRCFSQFSPERGSGLVILTNGLGGGELWTRLVAAIGDL